MVARDKRIWACMAALVWMPLAAAGQARTGYRWTEPGLHGLSTIGGDFGSYSTGLGGLDRSGGYAGGDVLRSGLSAGSLFQLRGRGVPAGGLASANVPGLAPPKYQSYGTVGLDLGRAALDAPEPARLLSEPGTELLFGVQAYLEAMGHASSLQMRPGEPITTFVPSEPSIFQKYMLRGDQAFRQQRYSEADDAFELALTFARHSPEANLSKAHARFALGSFNASAYHLERALVDFPELALVQLQIRGFYGRAEEFVAHLERLEKYAEGSDQDARAWLVLAYFRYFDGAKAEAAEALGKASELSKRGAGADTVKAITLFSEGVAAAGDGTGSATTQPAGQAGATPGTSPGSAPEPADAPAIAPRAEGPSAPGRADR